MWCPTRVVWLRWRSSLSQLQRALTYTTTMDVLCTYKIGTPSTLLLPNIKMILNPSNQSLPLLVPLYLFPNVLDPIGTSFSNWRRHINSSTQSPILSFYPVTFSSLSLIKVTECQVLPFSFYKLENLFIIPFLPKEIVLCPCFSIFLHRRHIVLHFLIFVSLFCS